MSCSMWITAISSLITAIATGFLAYYASSSFKLSQELKKMNEENKNDSDRFQQNINDLYQAIVIATILSGPTSTGGIEEAIKKFKSKYKGKAKIFE